MTLLKLVLFTYIVYVNISVCVKCSNKLWFTMMNSVVFSNTFRKYMGENTQLKLIGVNFVIKTCWINVIFLKLLSTGEKFIWVIHFLVNFFHKLI